DVWPTKRALCQNVILPSPAHRHWINRYGINMVEEFLITKPVMKAKKSRKPAILLIGGIDPQGCAGLTADIQTVSHHGCHPVPLITCLTEQTQNGMQALNPVSCDRFLKQYESCIADFEIAAIKIGLIPNLEI